MVDKKDESNGDEKFDHFKKLQELLAQLTTEQYESIKKKHEEYMNKKDPDEPAKSMEEFLFWKTQPVPRFDEKKSDSEKPAYGAIEHKKLSEVSTSPINLSQNIEGFEWCDMNINNESELDEVHALLNENYIEDLSSTMRFAYSKEFLKWAMSLPGTDPSWLVGIRVKASNKLVAFISAVPIQLGIKNPGMDENTIDEVKSVEINFLCVHKKLRSKRLAPVLIKEITRRVNLKNIWQALYTAGLVLPRPISTCRYTHRPLNWNKLYDVGFVDVPEGIKETAMQEKYKVENKNLQLIEFEEKYYEEVSVLFKAQQKRYKLQHVFQSKEEFLHQFLPRKDVLKSFVYLNDEGKVTDFISYYILPFNILGESEVDIVETLKVAYLYHYCSDCADTLDNDRSLTLRLNEIIQDMLSNALYEEKCDLFNCLTSQDNNLFIEKQNFGMGSGFLNFYLFNYYSEKMNGGIEKVSKDNWKLQDKSDIGVVMI